MKKYVEVRVTTPPEKQEVLIALFADQHVEGFEESEMQLKIYFKEEDFEEAVVNSLLQGYDYEIELLEEKNWNAVWEENFQPVRIGDFCLLRASFHKPEAGVKHDIVITPKMSFGTGHHATTHMMIAQMEHLPLDGATVFDFGTGTGVLAILAEKEGAASVFAIDVDEWSIANAAENLEQNGCNRWRLELSTQLPGDRFQVILANINRNVLLQYAEGLIGMLQPQGQLLISGIMPEDEAAMKEAFGRALTIKNVQERNGWLSMLWTN